MGVYIEEVPGGGRPIHGVPTSITAFLGSAEAVSSAVRDFLANGGSPALVVRVTGDPLDGLRVLDETDLFNILCIPGEDTPADVYAKAAAYCRKRRAMLIVDPPRSWDSVATAIANRDNLGPSDEDRNNAAVYFPRLGTSVPCGAIAGIYAATDARRGVWKAPAGIEAKLTAVDAPAIKLTDRENDLLNRAGINALRTFPGIGTVVWGARTMSDDNEWKYVPVRRLAIFLEESIDRGTKWTVFEPNEEPLWAEIRNHVGSFLHGLFRQGAFQGRTQREAYFVRCGRDTTTQADIDAGIVNIVIGFAPLKPAEFVVVRIAGTARSCPSCP